MPMELSLPNIFSEWVKHFLATGPDAISDWKLSEKGDSTELFIPKLNDEGFDVTVIADSDEISVYSEHLAHRHFTSDGNAKEVIEPAMGFVRDLLAPNMRLRVFEVNGSPYKAQFEVFHGGEWKNDGLTGLFVIPWFRKKTELCFTNNRLPERNPFEAPSS